MTEESKDPPPGGSEPHAAESREAPDLTWGGVVVNWLLVIAGGAAIALVATFLPDLTGSAP